MSCEIKRLVSGHDCVLFVYGRIDRDDVHTLREVIGQEKGGRVVIDLAEVTLVHREAIRLLAFSEANGIELRNSPTYMHEWVARAKNVA